MDSKPLSILITALATLILGTYVFAKNPKKIINISFTVLSYSSGIWALSLFVISIGTRYDVLRFAGHMAFASGALMACGFLIFAYVFPEKKEDFPPPPAWFLIWIPGLIFALLGFTRFVMVDITYVGQDVRPVYGIGIKTHVLYVIAYVLAGLYLLARKYMRNPGRFERVQLKYMFWGTLVTAVGVLVFTLVLPVAGISQYSGPLTAVVTMVATGGIAYAIVRHRLMDLGVVFRNALIFACMVVFLSSALISLLLLLTPVLRLHVKEATFLAVALASLAVNPVRGLMEMLVDRYFFRGRYNYQAALTEFSYSMTKILDLDDLQNRIVHEVASILQVRSAALLLRDGTGDRFTTRAAIPVELADYCREIDESDPIIKRINQEHSLLVRDELRRFLPASEYQQLDGGFQCLQAEILIPLFYREELIGLLSLGEKRFSDIYSVEDVNLLVTLGNQAAVALENALLHYAVIMLKNHNENILKYMNSGVIAIDKNRIINTCNDKAREILSLSQDGIISREIDVLPSPLREMLAETLNARNRFSNQEVQILSSAGTILYLGASTSLIKDDKGDMTGALLVMNDLTEIRVLEGEMWRADKLASLGTLAAGMAHEIKNPLVSIKTFAQLLPSKYEDREFRETFSSIAVDEVERINSIVEKLLEFARPSAPLFETTDIVELIEEVLLLLSTETAKLGVTVVRNYETPSAPIVCDKSQFKQALLNLCLNALQAIEAAPGKKIKEVKISVGLRKSRYSGGLASDQFAQTFYGSELPATLEDAETVVVRVRDTGHGISRKHLTNIFDPFFTTKEKGIGLGLAVVHGIIKEHSGNISVDSKENFGTEFVISLPVTQLFVKERA